MTNDDTTEQFYDQQMAAAVERNQAAYERLFTVFKALWKRDPTVGLDALNEAQEHVHASAVRLLMLAHRVGLMVYTADGPLTVATIDSNGEGGRWTATYSLSEDGKSYETAWHKPEHGPVSDRSVRVERWSHRGLEFHGYVDEVSRRLVQTG